MWSHVFLEPGVLSSGVNNRLTHSVRGGSSSDLAKFGFLARRRAGFKKILLLKVVFQDPQNICFNDIGPAVLDS